MVLRKWAGLVREREIVFICVEYSFFFHIIILGSRALCLWEPRKLTTRSVPLVVAQVLLGLTREF